MAEPAGPAGGAPARAVDVARDLDALAAAWRLARGQAIHGPNCSCCGGQPVVLHADALAEGIEHALHVRFRAAADGPSERLLADRPRAPGEDLAGWARALVAADPARGPVIVGVIRTMVDSIGRGPALRR